MCYENEEMIPNMVLPYCLQPQTFGTASSATCFCPGDLLPVFFD